MKAFLKLSITILMIAAAGVASAGYAIAPPSNIIIRPPAKPESFCAFWWQYLGQHGYADPKFQQMYPYLVKECPQYSWIN